MNKIISALNEKPYGKHAFKAGRIMRDSLLLGSMLTNCETWINLTEADIKKLEKPDVELQRKLLSVTGNPSKAFMSLELGITPVKFVITGRRVNFLYYILNEPTESIIHQVYGALKEDSRRGDFNHLVPKKI